jgi:hypothetical protein
MLSKEAGLVQEAHPFTFTVFGHRFSGEQFTAVIKQSCECLGSSTMLKAIFEPLNSPLEKMRGRLPTH